MKKSERFRIVEWTNDFCVIRFKTSQPAGEELDFRFLQHFRKPITRSKMSIRGKVPDFSLDCSHHGESYNEVKAIIILVASGHADIIRAQPLELEYEFDGKIVRYYPDLLVIWGDEIWVVEVKPDKKADESKARFEHIAKLFSTHRIHFFVWKKSAIIAQPRYGNARLVIRYQRCEVSALDRERIRLLFSESPVVKLGTLEDRDARIAFKLVIEGMLHIDWWSSLSRHSILSVWPIGRQDWPNVRQITSEHAPS